MEKEIFPHFELFPRLARVGRFFGKLLTPFPTEAPDFMSNHYRGAEEMLETIEPSPVQHYVDLAKEAQRLRQIEFDDRRVDL